jgi:hypothetical protein
MLMYRRRLNQWGLKYLFETFLVLTPWSIKMADFSDVTPCSLEETGQRFVGAYCLHLQGDSSLNISLTNWCYRLLYIKKDVTTNVPFLNFLAAGFLCSNPETGVGGWSDLDMAWSALRLLSEIFLLSLGENKRCWRNCWISNQVR